MKRLKLFCGIFALTIVAGVNAWVANETIALNSELSLPNVEQIAEGEDYEMNGFWDFWTFGLFKDETTNEYNCPRKATIGAAYSGSNSKGIGATAYGFGVTASNSNSLSNSGDISYEFDSDQNPGKRIVCTKPGTENCYEIECLGM